MDPAAETHVTPSIVSFTLHEQHVHTYMCDHCRRPIRYVVKQYRLGNGKFMPASVQIPPQCQICGSTPTDFVATMNGLNTDHPSYTSFNMKIAKSTTSEESRGPRSAELLAERAEAAGPGGNWMLDTASYTTCLTHVVDADDTVKSGEKSTKP